MSIDEDFEYFKKKKRHKTYFSKEFKSGFNKTPVRRKMRYATKKMENKVNFGYVEEKGELILKYEHGGQWEVKCKFFTDTKEVNTLVFQRYTSETDKPHPVSYSFRGDEIYELLSFVKTIEKTEFKSPAKLQIKDYEFKKMLLDDKKVEELVEDNLEKVLDFLSQHELSSLEVLALAKRKKSLEIFEKLLSKDGFEETKSQTGKHREEQIWQEFFEENDWIFGYGLNFIYTSRISPEKKLEQYTTGFNFNNSGKRIDGLLKTRGLINSLCFVEIKTHNTDLLKNLSSPYRDDCWQISNELNGALAQLLKTVHKSISSLGNKIELSDKGGNPTGENLFLYKPKSIIIIGSLSEFITEYGINEEKLASFELFRRNLKDVEIITFDELYERAKFILKENNEV